MSSRAIRLSRIHALNWYGYQDTLPVEGNLVLAGVTGSGKSILMDLVMLVLVGPERARHHFNRSATGSQSDRTLKSYCLLDTKREENGQPQYYRERGGITYVALEFTWPDSERIETWGLRIEFRGSADHDGSIRPFFCKGSLQREDFTEPLLIEEKRCLLDMPQFQKLIESKEGKIFTSTREYSREMAHAQHLNFNRDVLDRLLPSAMSFTNLKSFDDFCRRFVLPSEAVSIEDVTASYRDFLAYNRELEELKSQLEALMAIKTLDQKLKHVERDRDVSRYLHAELAYEHAKNLLESTKVRLQNLRSEDQEMDARVVELNQMIEQTKTERERILTLLNESEDGRTYLHIRSEVQKLESKVGTLRGLEQRVTERVRQRIAQAHQWLAQVDAIAGSVSVDTQPLLEAIERVESTEVSDIYPALTLLRDSAQQLHNQLRQAFQTEARELFHLRSQQEELAEQVQSLKQGLPPLNHPLLHALEDTLPILPNQSPIRTLREVCEVKDENWREALEVAFSEKFAILVDEDYHSEALRIFAELKASSNLTDSVPEQLISSADVLKLKPEVLPNSLANKIESKDPVARRLLDYLFGQVQCCESLQEFSRAQGDAVLANGLLRRGVIIQRDTHYTGVPFIGKRGLQRQLELKISQLRELEAGIRRLEPIEEALSRISASINQQIPDPSSLAQDLAKLLELPELHEEMQQKQDLLHTIDTAEFDRFTQQAEELKIRLNNLDDERFHLASQSKRHEIEQQLKFLEIREKEFALCEEAFTSQKVRNDVSIHAERLKEWRAEAETMYMNQTDVMAREFEKAHYACTNEITRTEGDLRLAMNTFKRQFSPKFDDYAEDGRSTEAYLKLLARIDDADIPGYEEKARAERANWEQLFRTQVLSRMHAALKRVEEIIFLLNQQLKRPIGRERYRIERQTNPEYKFYRELIEMNSLHDPDDLFFNTIHGELREALDHFLDTLVNKANSPEAIRLLDYRQYYDYKLLSTDINNPDAKPIDVDRQSGKMSGGENQSPYFVAILASYLQAYNRHDTRWKEPSLALVPIDEAFSKLSGERIQDCITAVGELDLQGLFSMSSGNIPYAFQLCEQLIVITKREDRPNGKTRIRNVPSLLMRDSPEGQQWMQKYGS